MEGKVKWWNTEKGYGFVVGEDKQDYFVHVSFLPDGRGELEEGEEISFSSAVSNGRRQAHDITIT